MKKVLTKTKPKARSKTKIKLTAQKIDFTQFRDDCKKIILNHAFKLSIDKKSPYKKKFEKLAIAILDFMSSGMYYDFDDLINDIKKQFKLKFEGFVVSVESPALFRTQKDDKLFLNALVEKLQFCIFDNKTLLERAGLSFLHEYSSIMELKKFRTLLKAGAKRDKQYKVISAIINRKEKELADFPKQILETLKLALENPVNIVNKQIIDTFKDTFLSDIDILKEWLKKSK